MTEGPRTGKMLAAERGPLTGGEYTLLEDAVPFEDRRDAGRHLGEALAKYRDSHPVVVALPRGGVPVGFEIAQALDAPLDLILVRKIGAPHQPELGLGALVGGLSPQVVLNEDLIRAVAPDPGYIAAEQKRQITEIERQRRLYLGDRPPIDIEGRTVILVDDGIATGGTIKAALRGLAQSRPARIVLAVPVAPPSVLDELAALADDVVCLATPPDFHAVGAHYRSFEQTQDDEVIALLRAAAKP